MKEVLLKNSKLIFIVDDEDYQRVLEHSWSLKISGNEYSYVVMNRRRSLGPLPIASFLMNTKGIIYDHIDRNSLNNQKSNLRIASYSQNAMNRSKQKGNYSCKYKGVGWHKRQQEWIARISFNNKMLWLGGFPTAEEAAKAYNAAAIKYHGAFAVLNMI